MQRFFLFFALPLLLFSLLPAPASADGDHTFSAYFENDTFFGTDREYTNGLRFSYSAPHIPFAGQEATDRLHAAIDRIPVVGKGDVERAFSISFIQNIYTPDDTLATEPVPDERPYAGISFIGVGLLKKTCTTLSTWEVGVGLVGEASLAEDTQRVIHEWGGWDQPEGWDHQLHNEPLFQVFYNRRWRVLNMGGNRGPGLDLIPRVEWGLGNALTYAGTGVEFRMGWNLPYDFGNAKIRPATETNRPSGPEDPRFAPRFHRFGIHLFAGALGNAVARNILLDGNTFKKSHSVDKEPFTGSLTWGIGMIVHRFKITSAYVYSSREFTTQKDSQSYGTISISYTW